MDNKELYSKIVEKMENDVSFFKAFTSAEDAQAVQKVLKDNGFDLTIDEIETMHAEGISATDNLKKSFSSDELTEEELSDVAGGGFFRGLLRTVASGVAGAAYGAFCAAVPAAYAYAPAVAGSLAVWSTAGYLK